MNLREENRGVKMDEVFPWQKDLYKDSLFEKM
jgi:hypothetical protein